MPDLLPNRTELFVAGFTGTYVAAFTIWFLSTGNYEFVVYVLTMLILMALVGSSLRRAEFPGAMLWALSLWGLAHMAGGGVPVNGSVLYNLRLVPLVETEWYFILKYDQLVHAFGFGVIFCKSLHCLFSVLLSIKTRRHRTLPCMQ